MLFEAPPRAKGFHEKFAELLIPYIATVIIMWHAGNGYASVLVVLVIFTLLKVADKPDGPVHRYTCRQLIGLYLVSVVLGCVGGFALYPLAHGTMFQQ